MYHARVEIGNLDRAKALGLVDRKRSILEIGTNLPLNPSGYMTGLIALDIDGTITTESRSVPEEVVEYLSVLYREGWTIAFVTGRTHAQSFKALEAFTFPFFLAVQNGAVIISMPDGQVLFRHYLSKETLFTMSDVCRSLASDVVVYSGYENGDRCYYCPAKHDAHILDYMAKRRETFEEQWVSLESFEQLPLETFASTKTFGAFEPMQRVGALFENELGLHAPVNRDPFKTGYYVLQTTHGLVTKGKVIHDLRKLKDIQGLVISAGDDINDISLLEAADIAIGMADGSEALLAVADIIAPPVAERGIIHALRQAVAHEGKCK